MEFAALGVETRGGERILSTARSKKGHARKIPQPDPDQLAKIKTSFPSIHIFPLTSHQLLAQLSSNQSSSPCAQSSADSCANVGKLQLQITGQRSNISETCVDAIRTSLASSDWPGWFHLVWLDYCGKVASGRSAKLRRLDLEMLFMGGMLASGGRPFPDTDPISKSYKPCLSVLAITMSQRAAPLR